jgi:ATP-dependent DNA ligase
MTFPITPPVKPMLAKLQKEIPKGDGWLYEPKWDGFRGVVFRDGDTMQIDSRNGQPLARYFPEVVRVLHETLPERCVVDGEIVIATPQGLDFDALQLRLHPAASRVNMLAEQTPATFIAFDLLALSEDVRGRPLRERFDKLVSSVKTSDQCFITPQTEDPPKAMKWFEEFEGAGLDGIVAKREELPYVEGERVMVKVKHQRTADCVVGGYRVHKSGEGVGSLLLGLYNDDGTLHFVGFTSSFKVSERKALVEKLKPYLKEGSFEGGRAPYAPSRWRGPKAQTEFVSLNPELVCEVAFDHLQGPRFRHGTTFLRWRPDKDAAECTFDQFEPPRPFSLTKIRKLSER